MGVTPAWATQAQPGLLPGLLPRRFARRALARLLRLRLQRLGGDAEQDLLMRARPARGPLQECVQLRGAGR